MWFTDHNSKPLETEGKIKLIFWLIKVQGQTSNKWRYSEIFNFNIANAITEFFKFIQIIMSKTGNNGKKTVDVIQ